MKEPERFPADDPRNWLKRASSNVSRAKSRLPDSYLEDLCFDAQQAAEKAIKALMIKRGIDFPYIHDLAQLLSLLKESGEEIPDAVGQARKLTRFATVTRYPMNQAVTETALHRGHRHRRGRPPLGGGTHRLIPANASTSPK